MVYCAVVLAACMMPLALGVIGFPFALLLFLALQLPAVLMRRQASPAGSSQAAASQSTDSDS
jgi:type III secretory pathway component EscV